MTERIQETLALYADDAVVVRELHDVPPYRVYEVRLDGRRAVLKIDDHPRGHAADEGRVHEYVATRTSASVPNVIVVGTNHYLTAWNDEIAHASNAIDAVWARAAGGWLGTLHADTVGRFDGYGRPRDDGDELGARTHDEWIDAARERLDYHRPFLDTHGYADVVDAVDRFLRDHPRVFDGAGEPVLCHGDVHPEHVVRGVDGTTVAIDFEHALVAPAEYDYWRTVMPYVEARDDVDDTVARAFRDGYATVHSLPDGYENRREVYALVNLVAFLESLFLQQTVGPDRREAAGERLRSIVFETLEAVREPVG